MKKRVVALTLALALVVALALTGCRAGGAGGDLKTVTVTVVHGDGTVREFALETQESYLGPALTEEGVAEGENGPYGLFLTTVDGETADEGAQQWWCLTKAGGAVTTGVDSTPIADGDIFELTLTEGY